MKVDLQWINEILSHISFSVWNLILVKANITRVGKVIIYHTLFQQFFCFLSALDIENIAEAIRDLRVALTTIPSTEDILTIMQAGIDAM